MAEVLGNLTSTWLQLGKHWSMCRGVLLNSWKGLKS